MIEACKINKFPIIGVWDHWKGMDRFFRGKELVYLPDEICCIDEYCKNSITNLGINDNCIHVVGHPSLENLIENSSKEELLDNEVVKLLLISQPFKVDRSFKGIFFLKDQERRIFDILGKELSDIFDRYGQKIKIALRLHPKEARGYELPEGIEFDSYSNWHDSLTNHQIFIGFDSMALIEASILGKPCISLNLPILQKFSERIPFHFDYYLDNLSNLDSTLGDLLKKYHHGTNQASKFASFKCSTLKLSSTIKKFINQKDSD